MFQKFNFYILLKTIISLVKVNKIILMGYTSTASLRLSLFALIRSIKNNMYYQLERDLPPP